MSGAAAIMQEYDPLKDKSYRRARLGPDVAAFLAWLELGGAATRTLDDYESALARFCVMYPATGIHDITDRQLGQVFRRFPERSRSTRVAPYTTFFKWARQTRRIDANPMEMLPKIRRYRKRDFDLFSDAEIEALYHLPVVDAAPLGLLFDGGLRRSEAIATTLRRCSGSDAIKVINGKGHKDRLVPKTVRLGQLLADLELLEGLGPDDHILYAVNANSSTRRVTRARPIGDASFARWWRRCLETAGVRYRNPHMARHTYATRMRRRGVAVDDLSMFLGHEDIATTNNMYNHSTFEEALARLRVIEEAEQTV